MMHARASIAGKIEAIESNAASAAGPVDDRSINAKARLDPNKTTASPRALGWRALSISVAELLGSRLPSSSEHHSGFTLIGLIDLVGFH